LPAAHSGGQIVHAVGEERMGRTRLLILVIVVMMAMIEYWYLYRPGAAQPPPPASVPAVNQSQPLEIIPVAPAAP
jgi:hypothetical protein